MSWYTVVCIASGPSLTADDVERVRQWRHAEGQDYGRAVIVTNTTFRIAPWADLLYARDRQWWLTYVDEVATTFAGERASLGELRPQFGLIPAGAFEHYNNSGAAAISLAAHRGAVKIVMLGYDCQHTNGRTHWHGDHPPTLGNAGSVHVWMDGFRALAAALADVTVINASRATAIDLWPRMALEVALAQATEPPVAAGC